ncbi:MAG: MBL fold metallo-hydrolase [Chitinophagaceae bacterium]|nr:MAG: MBL fold metallo-hydrolase [Chitinophagaceae bacterium]
MDQSKICITCGTEYPKHSKDSLCVICADDRQYFPESGQAWTSHDKLLKDHAVRIAPISATVYEFDISPKFAIGQRAFFIKSNGGNILWDCIPLLDPGLISFIKEHGGLAAIAISHPHYYSNMHQWAEQFDCPIYLHGADQQWIVGPRERVQNWNGAEKKLWDGISIIHTGGHFPGSTVLYVPAENEKTPSQKQNAPAGFGTALYCGDSFVVSPSKKHIAVMYSYPNRIPLPVAEVERITELISKLEFDSIYSFQQYLEVTGNAKDVFLESMKRYR